MKQIFLFAALAGLLAACAPAMPTSIPSSTQTLVMRDRFIPASSQTSTPIYNPADTQISLPAPTTTSTHQPHTDTTLERVAQAGGSINGIAVVGDLAFVGMGPRLAVINLNDHEHPRLVSQSDPLPGLVTLVIHLSGEPISYMVVNAGKYLVLVDTSDPSELKPVQQLALQGAITALVWDDLSSTLYAGGSIYQCPSRYTGFISAIAVTSERGLELSSSVSMPETPLGLAPVKDGLFAGANGYEGGLYYIQLKIPAELSTPRQVIASTPEAPLVPTSMQIIGDRLYLGYWGVQVYDISNPQQPVQVWTGGPANINIVTSLAIDGDQFYVTGFLIREPNLPVQGTFTSTQPIRGSAVGVAASITAMHAGDFIVADRTLRIYTDAEAHNLRLVGSYQAPVIQAMDGAANESAVFVVDNVVELADSNAILRGMRLPALQQLGQAEIEFPYVWGHYYGMAVEGDRIYIATIDGLWLYDVSSASLVLLGKVAIENEKIEALVAIKLEEKRLLFVAQSTEGMEGDNILRVYDLTDWQNPVLVGTPLTLIQGNGIQMTWNGSALCILVQYVRWSSPSSSMLYVIENIHNNLEVQGSLELTGYIEYLAADNNIIMLAGSDTKMSQSILITVKSQPLKIVSQTSLPEAGEGVTIVQDQALVIVGGADGGAAQLLAFDIHDPANPKQLEAMDIAASDYHSGYRVAILEAGSYVILANGAGGVEVFSFSG